ncbi:uncharacterized protein LOC110735344 [Chenopodium quinoa]|uniref:uncharacterized protein LOC110735344 n=1 Tax=Chenopodium quinoa TaxID=63459 RepID=UPI000B797CCB|nr:uncharacterized protein LOC110735344 [Chenopodium quinoa]
MVVVMITNTMVGEALPISMEEATLTKEDMVIKTNNLIPDTMTIKIKNFGDQGNMGNNQQGNVLNQGTGGNRGQFVSNYAQTNRPPGFHQPQLPPPQQPLQLEAPPIDPVMAKLDALLKMCEEAQKKHEEAQKRTNAHMKMLETQIAQLASNSSPSSSFPSSSHIPSQGVNPKPLYAVTTRSGKVVGSDPLIEEEPQEEVELENENEKPNEPLSVEKEKHVEVLKEKEATPLPLNRQPREEKLPFPQRFVRAKLDAQFGKFLEVIKSLHISVPFVDAMKQIPHYSKFLKDLLSGRRECETVSLTANCSAILSNKLPTKLKDPGNFSIPCSINGIEFDKALCDLGASVSLMPYSVYQKLSVGTLSLTNITLQLADCSVKFPMGKVEDIPLRVGKFTFLVDFYVLEMDEDERIPIIFGRPFLATSRAIIDVKEGKISLKIDNDFIEFDLNPPQVVNALG